jgi:hypothetical protein
MTFLNQTNLSLFVNQNSTGWLKHRGTGKCLNAYSKYSGAEPFVWACNPADMDQNWEMLDKGNGYVLYRLKNTGMCRLPPYIQYPCYHYKADEPVRHVNEEKRFLAICVGVIKKQCSEDKTQPDFCSKKTTSHE